jgi:hypothetical protein
MRTFTCRSSFLYMAKSNPCFHPPPSHKHGGILHVHPSSTVLIVKNCYTNIQTKTSYIAKQKDKFLFQCPSLQNQIRNKNFFPYILYISLLLLFIIRVHTEARQNTFCSTYLYLSVPSSTDRMETVELWISLKHICVCKDM